MSCRHSKTLRNIKNGKAGGKFQCVTNVQSKLGVGLKGSEIYYSLLYKIFDL